jgi:hypothetical protein
LFARSIVLVALAGCVADSDLGNWRGTGRGLYVAVEPRPDEALTEAGRIVAVVDDRAAAACRHIGYVTGIATRRGIRLADQDRAQLVATLSRDGAISNARNLAAAHQADAIAIDADETWETGRAVRYLVHARALRCHSAK